MLGRVKRDPEIKATTSGTAIANLTLTTDREWKDRSGEWKTSTDYHRVSAFGAVVDPVRELKDGDLALVHGRIENRSYEVNGEKRYSTEIRADSIQPLLGASSGKRTEAAPARSAPAPQTRAAAAPVPRATPPADDPFGDGTGITDNDLPDNMW